MIFISWMFFVFLNAYYGGALTMFFTSPTIIPFQTERDVRTLCVDPKKGLARKNGWDVDESEIHYLHHTEDKTNPRCKYAKLAVSEKVIGFIQAQMGLVFIGGSQGTVQWKGKDLVPDLEVELRPQ